MAAITTLRTTLATALTDNTKYSVFAFPPATPIANSVIISPADPYIEPNNGMVNTISPLANFKVSILVPLLDNEGNLSGIETDVVTVFNKIAASGLSVRLSAVTAPSVLSVATGDLLTCDLQVSILTEWS